VDGGECWGPEEQRGDAGGEYETSIAERMARPFCGGAFGGKETQEPIDTRGEVAVAGQKRSRQNRQTRAGTHTRNMNQRSGKRNGTARVSAHS